MTDTDASDDGWVDIGDDFDDALRNAPEALELYAESFTTDGKPMPRPRTLTELKADPEIAEDIKAYMVALIEFPARAHAAVARGLLGAADDPLRESKDVLGRPGPLAPNPCG